MSISADQLQAMIAPLTDQAKIAGIQIAVWHKGETVAAATGLANIPAGIEMTTDTVSHIGSITKVLNTTLIMQCVEEGLISLDDPLVKHIPDFALKDKDAAREITVRMCLNHTSGIDGEIIPDQGRDQETIEGALGRIAALDMLHEPDAAVSYCNAGSTLAGILLQRVTGKSWYDLMQERIFDKLALEHAVCQPDYAVLYRASVGHFLDQATGALNRTSHVFLPVSFAPAGATTMMSATDLVRFGASHIPGAQGVQQLLSAESMKAMATPTVQIKALEPASYFGLGWMVTEDGMISHTGGGPGIFSWLRVFPDDDLVIAVLTNTEHGGVICGPLMDGIAKQLVDCDPADSASLVAARKEEGQVAGHVLDSCVGDYHGTLVRHVIARDGDQLTYQAEVKSQIIDSYAGGLSPAVPLEWVCDRLFMIIGQTGAPILFEFFGEDSGKQAEYIATGARIYKRQDA